MKQSSSGSKVALWVALGILGLILLGVVVLGIFVFSFMRSAGGKQFSETISKISRIAEVTHEIADGLENFQTANGKFPAKLDELQPTLSAVAYKVLVDEFTYTPPSDSDPPNTVVLSTKDMPSLMGGSIRLDITKDFTCRQVQITPMPREGGAAKASVDVRGGMTRQIPAHQ